MSGLEKRRMGGALGRVMGGDDEDKYKSRHF